MDQDLPPDDGDGSQPSTTSEVSLSALDAGRPSAAVVEAVAAANEMDHTDLPPLQNAVDADALNTLVDGRPSTSRPPVRIEFEYAGVAVVVDTTDDVSIEMDTADLDASE